MSDTVFGPVIQLDIPFCNLRYTRSNTQTRTYTHLDINVRDTTLTFATLVNSLSQAIITCKVFERCPV